MAPCRAYQGRTILDCGVIILSWLPENTRVGEIILLSPYFSEIIEESAKSPMPHQLRVLFFASKYYFEAKYDF